MTCIQQGTLSGCQANASLRYVCFKVSIGVSGWTPKIAAASSNFIYVRGEM